MADYQHPEWEGWATVRVEHTMHVRFKYRAPHPDMIDNEAEEVALGKRIEEAGGSVSGLDDVSLEYHALSAEVETWHRPLETRHAA